MVQGLGFLSKKSWHTKNLANQEKVWMAEQRKEAEAQKTKELAKQIQQEREQEELEQISGKKATKLDRGIDWMYQGATNQGDLAKEDSERKAEEFLMGKEFVGDGATQGDFDNGDQDQGIHNVLKQPGAGALGEESSPANTFAYGDQATMQSQPNSAFYSEPSVKDRNEDFRLRVEDPMFQVSQQTRAKEVQHEKTKALYERVVGYQETDNTEKKRERKRVKKEKKRDKRKHKKKSSKHRRDRESDYDLESDFSRSDSDSRDHSRRHRRHERRRNRSRSRSPERKRIRNRRSPSYSRSDIRSNDPNHYHDRRRKEKEYSSRHDRKHDNRLVYDERGSDRERIQEDNRTSQSELSNGRSCAASRPDGYGLKGSSIKVDQSDLGPSRDLLQKRREEMENERRRIRETASNRRRRTEEERAQALAEMQDNVYKREASRSKHVREETDEDQHTAKRGDASFLKEMTRTAHGIGDNAENLSSRVAQNRHTNQRLHDSFL